LRRCRQNFVSALCLLLTLGVGRGQAGASDAISAPESSAGPPAIVLGFVGGYVRHDDFVHSEVQLAARLRREFPYGVHAEAFENHRGQKARDEILRLLDTNHDGKLSAQERQSARIILYGHSWGASEAVYIARALERDGIPVLLTVQVDSVAKRGENDTLIPANVAQAANFYQPKGLVHGHSRIRAADPARTRILGNFRFDYQSAPIRCERYPWYDRLVVKSHTEIECDPRVWNQIESLIRDRLAPSPESASAQ
jgi:hypothetical protein